MAECRDLLSSQLDMTQLKLSNISERLNSDPIVQENIQRLNSRWRDIGKELNRLLTREGLTLIEQKLKFQSEIRPNKNTLDQFTSTVINFREKLSAWADNVRDVQKEHHNVITVCQERKGKFKNEIKLITISISTSRQKISSKECEIQRCKNDVISFDNEARQLEIDAAGSRQRSRIHLGIAAVGSGIGILAGAALAPFTGGTSLIIAFAGAGMHSALHGTAALVAKSSANCSERNAQTKREKVCRLEQQIQDYKRNINTKEQEVLKLTDRKNALETTVEAFYEVERIICILIEEVEIRLSNVQDVEAMLHEISLNGKALKIVLCAFGRKRKMGIFRRIFGRKVLDTQAERLKSNIQAKWDELERTVLPNKEQRHAHLYPQLNHPSWMISS